jgi:hypothetical protein
VTIERRLGVVEQRRGRFRPRHPPAPVDKARHQAIELAAPRRQPLGERVDLGLQIVDAQPDDALAPSLIRTSASATAASAFSASAGNGISASIRPTRTDLEAASAVIPTRSRLFR